ncbi:MAG: N(4)-(beta-N-acetylglucosaminyl)-L-asparaginase [Flavobacteriales bacterium]|jgi:N4-(beta-N-acetylglucosaminyl)-L-asparaginase
MKNISRRNFITKSTATAAAATLGLSFVKNENRIDARFGKSKIFKGGIALSTWDAGVEANAEAIKTLNKGGSAVDMAEEGVKVIEADFRNLSVGLGGLPDREGNTTLDACIMDSIGRAGSVCFLEKIKHPVIVARMVMERTPHVMLVGEGAQKFALSQGMTLDEFKSEEAIKAYQEWLIKSEYKPIINIENHDTIGMVTMDKQGDLAGSCTTSGLAYKMRGRVGDSPIIGSGLYVDNEVGAATGTGLGETVLRSCSAFLIVEMMRQGMHPQKACEEAVKRVQKINSFMKEEFQVGLLAVNKKGEIGAFALREGFTYALAKNGENMVYKSDFLIK